MTDDSRSAADTASGGEPRRSFVTKAAAFLVGAVVSIVPVLAAAVTFFDPLLRRKKGDPAEGGGADPSEPADDGFLKITNLQSLPADGSPRMFPVIADLQDAWNKFPDTEIGSIYLWRSEDGGVMSFNARCPHLGCTVNYKSDQSAYTCPCHDSAFSVEGERSNDIPPRNLDPLEAELRNGEEVWVKFQKFRAGIHDRQII